MMRPAWTQIEGADASRCIVLHYRIAGTMNTLRHRVGRVLGHEGGSGEQWKRGIHSSESVPLSVMSNARFGCFEGKWMYCKCRHGDQRMYRDGLRQQESTKGQY